MDAERLLTALIGAFFGAAGWLVVGVYMQSRQFQRQARNAARAVYFEITVNEVALRVAREHGLFQQLSRSSFDRLLPELATLFGAQDLRLITAAYMSHAGYEQLQRDPAIPAAARHAVLDRALGEQAAALDLLASRVFSAEERSGLQHGEAPRARATGERALTPPGSPHGG